VAGDADAMASRTDLLRRLAVALARPGVDGVLGTADILEDLLLLGLLEDKVAFGSMNRGGLAGASYELDDRFTGYTAQAIAAHRLEGGKMLTRICLTDSASAATMEASARAVTDLADRGLVAMVEPFWSERAGTGAIRNLLDPDSVIRSMHVAAGLGATSAYTWLKLPVVPEMGAGPGRHDAAGPAARRRPGQPGGRDVLGLGAGAAEPDHDRPGRGQGAALPRRRGRGRGGRRRGAAGARQRPLFIRLRIRSEIVTMIQAEPCDRPD
jgi:hypothetical protein